MLSRRKFLETSAKTAGAGLTFLLIPIACGSSDDSTPITSTGTTVPPCDGVGADSTIVENHSHAVCISAADLAGPPENGRTYTTTLDDAHTHTITLTASQLRALANGERVDVTTSLEDSHTHGYALIRTTTPNTGGGGGGGGSSGGGPY